MCSFDGDGAVYNLLVHFTERLAQRHSSLLIFSRLGLFPVHNMDVPVHSHRQLTPGDNHTANFPCQCLALYQVSLIFFGYVSLADLSLLARSAVDQH